MVTKKTLRAWTPVTLALGLLLTSTSARAVTYYDATLSGATQVPVNASPGIGFGTVLLNDAMDTITADETWSGLLAPATATHIHTAAAGVNGPVTFPFSGVPNATAGSIPTQSFAINATQLANLQGATCT